MAVQERGGHEGAEDEEAEKDGEEEATSPGK